MSPRLRSRLRASPLALCAAFLAPEAAHAAGFAEDGTFVFDPAAVVRIDLEDNSFVESGGLEPTEVPDALSGTKVLKLGNFQGFDYVVTLPAEPATYRVSFWVRGGAVVGSLTVAYSDRGTDEVGVLYPTGRMTSDGWVELANSGLRVDGARAVTLQVGGFAAWGGEVDAIEIVRDGGPWTDGAPNAPCEGSVDEGACAEGQICLYSECKNVNGWVPPIPTERDDVARYLANRAELLFGPYLNRTLDLPESRAWFDSMTTATHPWAYWNGFMAGIRRLHDGHTSTSGVADFVLFNPRPLAICFLEGDADLSYDTAPKDPDYLDVVVSHVGGDHNLGLRPGDRLVSIDGRHPIAWARTLTDFHWSVSSTSNPRTYAELASSLQRFISRFAHEIQVIRCDPERGACGAVETVSIADLPLEAEGSPIDGVSCDNRPVRHQAGAPADHRTGDTLYAGVVTESDDVEKIYGIEWESLYTTNGQDGMGAQMKAAVASWKSAGARGVVLDHRTGFGGTFLGPKPIWDYAVPKYNADRYIERRRDADEQPTLEEGLALFAEGVSTGDVDTIGSVSPNLTVPVALLVTEDISASDWLAFGLKGAPNTRIFGPYETNGGFSTRFSFGYWLGLNYVIATGDTVASDGRTLNGAGVAPDVIVLPKQSDLLIGRDTVYEAALAWVRQELAP
jgi:hypothetical protein